MAVPLSASAQVGSLGDVAVRQECGEPDLHRRVVGLCQSLFAFQDGAAAGPEAISLSFGATGGRLPEPSLVRELPRSGAVRVWKTEQGAFLRYGSSGLKLEGGRGLGVLAEDFWDSPLQHQREFFLLGFPCLLHAQGRYGLHAGAVTRGAGGCLIVGYPGNGKTTVTINLVRQGWSYLSDDLLVLRERPRAIEAVALRRGFSCRPGTATQFAELQAAAARGPLLSSGKRLVDSDAVYPGRFTPSCYPWAILFPRIVTQPRSELIRLDETEAMVSLIPQSAAMALSSAATHRQLIVLRRLLQQAASYQLQLGTDALEDPEVVPTLLSEVEKI